jgi:hypothetical protein
MVEFFKFQWLCIKDAWRGCWTRANETAGLLGAGILWLLLFFLSPRLREHGVIDAPTTYLGVAGLTFLSAAVSVILAFFVIFIGRLITAPVRLYFGAQREIETLREALTKPSEISLSLEPQWAIEGLTSAARIKTYKTLFVSAENVGAHHLRDCQITMTFSTREIADIQDSHFHPVSKIFNLRQGERKQIPVIRVPFDLDEDNSGRIFLFHEIEGRWSRDDDISLVISEGEHEFFVKALSADSKPAHLKFKFVFDGVEWGTRPCT